MLLFGARHVGAPACLHPVTCSAEAEAQEEAVAGASSDKSGSGDSGMEKITKYLTEKLKLYDSPETVDQSSKQKELFSTLDLDGIVEYINKQGSPKIITMAGAGISTCKRRSMPLR